jgi:hypothetical protein
LRCARAAARRTVLHVDHRVLSALSVLQAVSVEDGALAGAWGVKIALSTVATFPVFGEIDAGGDTYYLTVRTWNEADAAYDVDVQLCGGRTYDTIAGTSTIPHASYQTVTVVEPPVLIIDHARGTYAQNDLLELWALADLPDPWTTELPQTPDEAASEPHASRITDPDEDANPGLTSSLEGAIEGHVYFIQRRVVQLDPGVVVQEGKIQGLVTHATENITVGSDNEVINQSLEEVPNPDPKKTWFEEVRLGDEADCEDVLAAIEDETISRVQPF